MPKITQVRVRDIRVPTSLNMDGSAPLNPGRRLADIVANFREFYRELTVDKQLRWLGPEKGILHMATGAVINAVWDLGARREGKPLWKLVVDMPPEQLVSCL